MKIINKLFLIGCSMMLLPSCGTTPSSENPTSNSTDPHEVKEENWVAQVNNAGYVKLFDSRTLAIRIYQNDDTLLEEHLAKLDDGKIELINKVPGYSGGYFLSVGMVGESYKLYTYFEYDGIWSRNGGSTTMSLATICSEWLLLTPYTIFPYSDFTYNAQTGIYHSDRYYTSQQTTFTNVNIGFNNGELNVFNLDIMGVADDGVTLVKKSHLVASIENIGTTRVNLPVVDGEQEEIKIAVGEEVHVTYGNSVNCVVSHLANHKYIAYIRFDDASYKPYNNIKWYIFHNEDELTYISKDDQYSMGYFDYQENDLEGEHKASFKLIGMKNCPYTFKVLDVTEARKEEVLEWVEQVRGCTWYANVGYSYIFDDNPSINVMFTEKKTLKNHKYDSIYIDVDSEGYHVREKCSECHEVNYQIEFAHKVRLEFYGRDSGMKYYELEKTVKNGKTVYVTMVDKVYQDDYFYVGIVLGDDINKNEYYSVDVESKAHPLSGGGTSVARYAYSVRYGSYCNCITALEASNVYFELVPLINNSEYFFGTL